MIDARTPDADMLEALATAFAVLGRLQREAPDAAALDAFRSMITDWPLPNTEQAKSGIAEIRASHEAGESDELVRRDYDLLYGDSAAAKVAPYESVH